MLGALDQMRSMRQTRHVWVLDEDRADYLTHKDSLQQAGLQLTVFAGVEAMLAAVRDPLAPFPSLLVVDAASLDRILLEGPGASARAAMLKHVPFVIVTDGSHENIIRGAFDRGALDSLRKPFTGAELVTKLDRLAMGSLVPEEAGRLQFNMAFLTVAALGHEPVTLTPREFQILTVIYKGDNHTSSRRELFSRVWAGVKVCNKVLDVHVSKLRKKLAPLGVTIQFVRPNGYQVDLAAAGLTSAAPLGAAVESKLAVAE